MARFLKKNDRKAGLPPGSLVFTGTRKIDTPLIRLVTYSPDDLRDSYISGVADLAVDSGSEDITWLNIDGVHDSELIRELGDYFNLSHMSLEDVQDVGQRPAITEYPEYMFLTMKVLCTGEDDNRVQAEQVSFVLVDNCLITFQEQPGTVFDPVRSRLSRRKGRIRSRSADYLLYALLDCILENYLELIERIGDRIEDMEEEVIDNPEVGLLEDINFYRREIAYVRKSIRPVREILSRLNRSDSDFIAEDNLQYFKELSGMSEQIIDSVEIYKEMISDLYGTYTMAVSTRLNETMKFLTVFATIFIPLTFLAGIYGMNFEFIPELKFRYGYYALLAVMLVIACLMLIYFKRKKWI